MLGTLIATFSIFLRPCFTQCRLSHSILADAADLWEVAMKYIEVTVWAKDVLRRSYICEVLQESPIIKVVNHSSDRQRVVISDVTILSPAEKRVLKAFRQHDGAKEVAAALNISPATVKKHLERIYNKLGVRSLHRALVQAARMRLIELEE